MFDTVTLHISNDYDDIMTRYLFWVYKYYIESVQQSSENQKNQNSLNALKAVPAHACIGLVGYFEGGKTDLY